VRGTKLGVSVRSGVDEGVDVRSCAEASTTGADGAGVLAAGTGAAVLSAAGVVVAADDPDEAS
jgi:hypothetical protein